MRRLLTLALALGLAALVAVAAVDALRGGDESGAPAESERAPDRVGPAALTGGAELASRLAQEGVGGTLFLGADGCLDGELRRLRALRLPDLLFGEGPRSRTCSFSLSADGEYTAGADAVWHPRETVFAAPTGANELTVIDAAGTGRLTLAGSAPAFEPDGTFVQMRAGRVVEWTTDCAQAHASVSPPLALGPEQTGPYCTQVRVGLRELARALRGSARLEAVDALVPVDGSRILAVLRTGEGSWLAAYEGGRALGYANGLVSPSRLLPKADPTGDYVALATSGFLEVRDRETLLAYGSPYQVTGYDWSPDGRWLALAARRRVLLVRAADWTVRFSLPLSTEGIAWR